MKKGLIFILCVSLLFCFSATASAVNLQDESIYHVAVDRFYNGTTANDGERKGGLEHFLGGDLQGVIKKLDYIKGMGFTIVSLSPIFQNEANGFHGKWVKDFKKVDEHFGTMQDLKQLTKEAHKRDLKVMIDFVFETGPNHPWLSDPAKKEWFVEGSTTFDVSRPDVQAFIIDVAKWWIKQSDIDGYRLIDANRTEPQFLKKMAEEIKSVKKDFVLVADIGGGDPNTYQNSGIDAVMNTYFAKNAQKSFSNVDEPLSGLDGFTQSNLPVVSFLDDEDIVRFTRKAVENEAFPVTRLKLALTYLYTLPVVPFVYYGTEIALDGGNGAVNYRMMDFRTSTEIVEYITNLADIRKILPSLRTGQYHLLYEKDGMLVYQLKSGDETSIIAINNTSQTKSVTIGFRYLPDNHELRGYLKGGSIKSSKDGYTITLERETAEIFKLDEQKGASIPFISILVGVPVLFILFLYAAYKKGKGKQPS
ncbi:alpha-amylase family glycosyl hydrolase [Aeribacillus pallidus]|uniref:Glycosyl hydrolase family 13 catalytic domain-containing protein n=1 Tax=Aeribacillus pallidus TaxID=33936 RepID=A0A223E5I9_9BACI|nr:alpha-amylase family glycosyl hydrolase [Aeribacillus pallidus]ASS90496.1 hypothetical protein AP3564_09945 [Aeribacillus pallidus]